MTEIDKAEHEINKQAAIKESIVLPIFDECHPDRTSKIESFPIRANMVYKLTRLSILIVVLSLICITLLVTRNPSNPTITINYSANKNLLMSANQTKEFLYILDTKTQKVTVDQTLTNNIFRSKDFYILYKGQDPGRQFHKNKTKVQFTYTPQSYSEGPFYWLPTQGLDARRSILLIIHQVNAAKEGLIECELPARGPLTVKCIVSIYQASLNLLKVQVASTNGKNPHTSMGHIIEYMKNGRIKSAVSGFYITIIGHTDTRRVAAGVEISNRHQAVSNMVRDGSDHEFLPGKNAWTHLPTVTNQFRFYSTRKGSEPLEIYEFSVKQLQLSMETVLRVIKQSIGHGWKMYGILKIENVEQFCFEPSSMATSSSESEDG